MRTSLPLAAFAAFAALTAASSAHAGIDVNFNASTDLATNFNQSLGAGAFVWNSTAGVGPSGGLIASGVDTSYLANSGSEDFSATGAKLYASMLINPFAANIGNDSRVLTLAVAKTNTENLATTGAGELGLRFNNAANNANNSWNIVARYNNGNTGATASANLDPNNWYLVTLIVENIGGGSATINGTVQDYGINGLTPGAIAITLTQVTVATNGITSDTAVWGGIRSSGTARVNLPSNLDDYHFGTTAYTQAPPIPEPASLGVLALGALGLLARRRK